eukprot:1145570-Pelagomonas_calceolata.AAC.2
MPASHQAMAMMIANAWETARGLLREFPDKDCSSPCENSARANMYNIPALGTPIRLSTTRQGLAGSRICGQLFRNEQA